MSNYRRKELAKKITASLLLLSFSSQPYFSTVVFANTNTTVSAPAAGQQVNSQNIGGTVVVNINNPQGPGGLSHNKFSDLQVGKEGIVFNNSQNAINTQLAGNISGNSNLTNGPAGIILNEVTGSKLSELNGMLEIAGQQASLIIANPNGINAAGVGFINTNRVVLTTGVPTIDAAGNLEGFTVNNASEITFADRIETDTAGAETGFINGSSTTPRIDLISRAVKINGTLQAEELNVVTGANKVAYSDLQAEQMSAATAKPALALDVSALGGMYAGRITMVGTENGVGVKNAGVMEAVGEAGSILLNVNGRITFAQSVETENGESSVLSRVTAQKNIELQSSDTIEFADDVTAGVDFTANAKNIIADKQLTAGIYRPTSATDDGAEPEPVVNAAAKMTLTAADTITNAGAVSSEGSLTTTAGLFTNSGSVSAASITVSGKDVINQGSIDQSGTGVTTVALSGTLSNTAAGSGQNSILRTSGDLKLTAQEIVNAGNSIILSSQAAEVTAADISNENSTISAQNGNMTITADNLKNDGGFLKARQAFSLSSKQNSLSGTIDAGTDLDITNTDNGSLTLAKNAVLRAGGDISVIAGVIDNAGVLLAQNDIIFTAGSAANQTTGRISAQKNVDLPDNFTNEGTLTGSNVVDIPPEQPDKIPQFTAPDTGVSTDKAAASDFVKIEADKNAAKEYKPIVEKTNSGIDIVQIASANSDGVSRNLYTWFDVNKSGLILNNATEYVNTQLGGYVDYNYRLGLRPAKIILNEVTSANPSSINGFIEVAGHRAGVVIANANGIVVDNGGFINTSHAVFTTGKPVMNGGLDAYQVNGGSVIITGKGLDAKTTDRLDIVSADAAVTAGVWGGDEINVVTGHNSVDAQNLQTQKLNNSTAGMDNTIDIASVGGMYAGKITLVANDTDAGIKNFGNINASGSGITLASDGKLAQHGRLAAQKGSVSITAGGDIYNSQQILAGTDLQLQTKGDLLSTGTIGSETGIINLTVAREFTQTGSVRLEKGALNINVGSDLYQYGNISVQQGGTLLAVQGNSGQYGTISSEGDFTFDTKGTLRQHGQIAVTDGNADFTAGSAFRQYGDIILANGSGTVSAGGDALQAGKLVAQKGSIAVTAANDLKNTGTISAAAKLDINTVKDITQIQGVMIGGNGTVVNANNLTNNGGVIFSGADIDLTIKNKLQNLNSASIYAQGDVTIGSGIGKTTELLNQSSTIRGDKNVHIAVGSLTNEKREFITGWDVTETDHDIALPGFSLSGKYYNARRYFHRVVQDGTIYLDSPAAYILSGADMTIDADTVDNEYSFITAGHDLDLAAAGLTNIGYKNIKRTTETGTDVKYWKYKKHRRLHHHCHYVYGQDRSPYYLHTRELIDGGADSVISAGGSNNTIITTTVNRTIDAQYEDLTVTYTPTAQNPAGIEPSVSVPQISDLTSKNPLLKPADPTADYLIEMDPRFTNYKNFLSSDYLFERISRDPQKVMKRLGDGFTEQQLIRDQILNLTGKQYLAGFTSDEEQFKELMNNAAIAADKFDLTVGVALTAEQMANLTTDIVWMVEQEVNGQNVLVPVVYLASVRKGELKPDGALLAGGNIHLVTGDTLTNTGSIVASDRSDITAGSINNLGGTVKAGKELALTGKQDIINAGGTISGTNISLEAGNNIVNETTTSDVQYRELHQVTVDQVGSITASGDLNLKAGQNVELKGSVTAADGNTSITAGNKIDISSIATGDRVAVVGTDRDKRINVNNNSALVGGKNVQLQAGGDLALTGSHVTATDSITATAGGNIKLKAVKDRKMEEAEIGHRGGFYYNRVMTDDEKVQGSSMSAGGDISLQSGRDINLTSSNIASEQGKITGGAAGSVNLNTMTEHHESIFEEHKKKIGFLSSKTTDIYDAKAADYNVGSNISGDSVDLTSGEDTNITASNVVADNDVNITAGGNVNIIAAEDTSSSTYKKQVKKSGLLSGGGLGFTIGSEKRKDQYDNQNVEQAGSTVGSIKGSVNVEAGKDVSISASDVLAGKDINLTGQNVTIESADNTYNAQEKHEYKKSGLTVSLTTPALSVAESVHDTIKKADSVKDDRLKALIVGKEISDLTKSGKDSVLNQTKDGLKDGFNADDFSLNISIGSQKSKTESSSSTTIVQGSTVKSGGNVNITATEKDINIKGSDISGEDVSLAAKGDVNITSAKNTNTSSSDSKASSGSIGVSINTSGISDINAGYSKYKGEVKENGTTHTNSTVTANDKLTVESGKDTNISGSKVSGGSVEIHVGGNLNIESQQDSQKYDEKYTSGGLNVNINYATGAGISGGASSGTTKSDYNSVTDQSGIYAGEGGFNITVDKNTDLKGGVIDSDTTPDKNKLTTGTLTWEDIDNKAEYSSKDVGINVNINNGAKDNEKGVTPNIGMPAKGEDESTTQAGVAQGTIEIKDKENQKQNIEDLNRDTKNTLNKLEQIFDKQTVAERKEMADLFGELAYNFVGDLAIKNGWAEGSPEKVALHAFVGGIMSELTGSGFLSGASGAAVNEFIQKQLSDAFKDNPDMHQWASALVGAVVSDVVTGNAQAGASSAVSGTKDNYLTHKQYTDYLAELESCKGDADKEKEVQQKYEVISALQDKEWLKAHPFEEYAETIKNVDGSISYVSKEQVVGLNTDGSTAYLRPGEVIVIGNEDISKIVDKIKPGNIIQMPDGKRYYVQPNGELKENADLGAFMTYQKVSFEKGDVETYRDMYIFGADAKIADDFKDKAGEAVVDIPDKIGKIHFASELLQVGAVTGNDSAMIGATVLIAYEGTGMVITTTSFINNVVNSNVDINELIKDKFEKNDQEIYDHIDKGAKMVGIVGDVVNITAAAKAGKFNSINWDRVAFDDAEREKAKVLLSSLGLSMNINTIEELIE